jgi:glyoxylase-like metal-dependent hydrolase (beta-lactamase superfamily II)
MGGMKIETVVVGALGTNCYLAYCERSRGCAVVDPGAEPALIFQAISRLNLEPAVLLNTHGHVDHVGANQDVKDSFGIPLHIHRADLPLLRNSMLSDIAVLLGAKASPEPDAYLEDGQEISFGEETLRVLTTPGHSPGSVSFQGGDFLLSGDTLFCGGVGRTDLPGGDWTELIASIRNRILTLPGQTRVYPGHGPDSTVDQERDSNPFLR